MRNLNDRTINLIVFLFVLLAGAGLWLIINNGIDFSSKTERDLAASQDAQTVLDFALTGLYDPENKASNNRVLGDDVVNAFQKNLKQDIKDTFAGNASIADEVEFNNKIYQKDQVLNQLVDRYLATVWNDKDYSITKIKYDSSGNLIVDYSVKPINIDQVQQDIQLEVNAQVDNFYPEGANRPTQPKMTLIELVLMSEQWNSVVKTSNLPTSDEINASFNMNFHRNFRDPYFSVDSSQLMEILNSGIVASQRGN